MGIKWHPKWCSYIAPLVRALSLTPGDVVELGAGLHSTYLLHWLCLDQGRELYTYENSRYWYDIAAVCTADWHHVELVADWDDVLLERWWGVALVDHAPMDRRATDIVRLADWAQIVLVHDSQGRDERHYHLKAVWPHFSYVASYTRMLPHTTICSNSIDVRRWFK
jgi:hypothetical protein